MITSKRKRFGGHWIMRDGVIIGEAWKFKTGGGFGMSIGGHFTKVERVYWRNDAPSPWGALAVKRPRLSDLVVLAEKNFGKASA